MRLNTRLCAAGIIVVGILMASTVCAADAATETEQIMLLRIADELEYLQSLAAKARTASDPSARIQFDYAAFIADLQEIQTSIERHVSRPQRTPRKVTPIIKRYTP
jgi:RAQPRD family integrative conjugative element protein